MLYFETAIVPFRVFISGEGGLRQAMSSHLVCQAKRVDSQAKRVDIVVSSDLALLSSNVVLRGTMSSVVG